MRTEGPVQMERGKIMQETGAYEESDYYSNESPSPRPAAMEKDLVRNGWEILICPGFLQKSLLYHSYDTQIPHMPTFLACLPAQITAVFAKKSVITFGGPLDSSHVTFSCMNHSYFIRMLANSSHAHVSCVPKNPVNNMKSILHGITAITNLLFG